MPGPQEILKTVTSSLGLLGLQSPLGLHSSEDGYAACPKPELSCQTRFDSQDTCCFNYPGGQFLQTQFWDADPAVGPDDSWTIHGLWPDHCDGSFDQYCDSSRRYSNISLILVDSGRADLLEFMQEYWKDLRGDDASLWEHEWNKHGTCISTLETRCYTDYIPQQEVVDYFNKTVELFQFLPSYEILAKAGIVPSHEEVYSLDEIQNALREAHGAEVTVRCRHNSLNEIWYHFNVAGRLQTGKFMPADAVGPSSNCPRTGIRYPPKRSPPTRPKPTTTTSHSGPEPTGPPVLKGHLKVFTLNHRRGCLISRGTWFTSGTCATFRAKDIEGNHLDGGFTLESSKGPCTFEEDIFTCGPWIKNPVIFQLLDDGKLSFNGNATFFADKAPKGPVQSKIFASKEDHPINLEIVWDALS
ncbi:hypothetical protein VTN96DRAFT_1854 [Rasamsonia emersonii]|uniref:Ribonuclease T2-like n=1 Tax=Rasamsonia emersonii (strain ATCC 16479 / CBS 393.64 / IMI 116815) TaxID=1408163 RepID=A0A0F4YN33_RASE3|nr:Ribonuclease T(2) [Rasamsonia emersonii CBS 393.64]KKA19662.1 Ribonuclease T(2) [Rasamsonia emersonii CBS 393.64]